MLGRAVLLVAAATTCLFAFVEAEHASLAAFVPCGAALSGFLGGVTGQEACHAGRTGKIAINMAHHPNPKGAKKYEKNRPRKHSLADINRKPPAYAVDTMALARQKLPEYTVLGQSDMSKYVKVTKADGSVFYHVKAPFTQG